MLPAVLKVLGGNDNDRILRVDAEKKIRWVLLEGVNVLECGLVLERVESEPGLESKEKRLEGHPRKLVMSISTQRPPAAPRSSQDQFHWTGLCMWVFTSVPPPPTTPLMNSSLPITLSASLTRSLGMLFLVFREAFSSLMFTSAPSVN